MDEDKHKEIKEEEEKEEQKEEQKEESKEIKNEEPAEIEPPPNRNNTSFPLALKEALAQVIRTAGVSFLKYYQILTKTYFEWIIKQKITPTKGLLITHVPGAGKSITAVSIGVSAMDYNKKNSNINRVIVVLLKSLQENFIKNIDKVIEYANIKNTDIKSHFKFVSFNASNMIKQLWQAAHGTDDPTATIAEVSLGQLLQTSGSLENTLIIVDEFHLLLRQITNGSKNGHAFYSVIMKTAGVKLLGLTGSIVSNDPFEIAVCYNMISGQVLFPENWVEFRRIYCDEKGKLLPEMRGKFQNRIMGLTSYISIGDLKFNANAEDEQYTPQEKPEIKVEVKMTEHQKLLYFRARKMESQEKTFANTSNIPSLTKPKSQMQGTYRQRSRQLSNFAPPFYFMKSPKLELLDPKDSYSPKFEAILKNITTNNGTHIVYSQFVGAGGLGVFKMYLDINGFESFTHPKLKKEKPQKIEIQEMEDFNEEDEELPLKPKEDLMEKIEEEGEKEIEEINLEDEQEELKIEEELHQKEIEQEKNPLNTETDQITKNKDTKKQIENINIKIGDLLHHERGVHPPRPPQNLETYGMAEQKESKKYKYALFTGAEDNETREEAIRVFSSKENINGDLIKVLMISAAGSLGVDTSNCRYVHLMEPYWTYDRVLQVKARAIRLNSHRDLPPEERFVQPYMYFASPGDAEQKEESTDQELYNHALENYETILTWIDPIRETSIECATLAELLNDPDRKCRVCAPSNQMLFSDDINMADPCFPYSKTEKETKKITIDGVDIFYDYDKLGQLQGYVMDLGLGAYRRLNHGEKLYELLIEKI